MSKEEALGLGIGDEIEGRADDVGEENKDGDGGVVDGEKRAKGKAKRGRRVVGGDVMRDEFYRLQAKDLEDWENRRVERLPGEHDGRL